MKNRKIKPILALALTALLLAFAVGGTLAYLVVRTPEVVNTFEPTQVSVTVSDEVEGKTKSDVVITNTSSVKAYIRAAIVGNWQDENDIVVEAWENNITAGTGWIKSVDGYYYYTLPVEPDAELKTANNNALFDSYTAGDAPTNSFGVTADHLQLDILVQAIQAEPDTAVESAWSVTVGEGGVLIVPGSGS